jgi:lysozyme family protein
MTFDEAFEALIGHEGGYVNDPRDPGGETKFGISKRAYPSVDIRNLTLDGAKAIYRRDYWAPIGCDNLPAALRFHVFDAAVNSGLRQAVQFLQRAVGVAADGRLGPVTRAAVMAADPASLAARYSGARLQFMTELTTWPTFGKGWARRIASNLMKA